MTGSLRHVGADRWKLTVYAGRDPVTGRDRHKSRTFAASGEREAKRMANKVAAELDDSIQEAAAQRGTIKDLSDRWLAHKALRCSPVTMDSYRWQASLIVARFGRLPAGDLRGWQIDEWYDELLAKGRPVRKGQERQPMTPGTLLHIHAVLRAMLRQGRKWRIVSTVATEEATPPSQPHRRIRPPTTEAVRALVAQAEGMFAVIVALVAATGMRRGELCGLRWTDLDGNRLMVRRSVAAPKGGLVVKATKTGRERLLLLDAATVRVLDAWRLVLEGEVGQLRRTLADDAFMFPSLGENARGRVPLSPATVTHWWADLRGDATVRLHDLRHWHASELLSSGQSVAVIAERLGHSQVSTTLNVYSAPVEGDDQRAADAIGELLAGN